MRVLYFIILLVLNNYALHYPLANQGTMFDSTNQSYYPCAVDCRGRGLPFDFAIYASTDHSSGGIWMYVCSGDPSVKSNWITYDSAKNAGLFDSYQSKPDENPVFNDDIESTGGAETPCVNWVRDTLFMSYQVVFSGVIPQTSYMSGLSQGTAIAYSTDGVNFTRYTAHTGGVSAILLPEPLNTPSADHTGYFVWGLNPFDSIPYTYIGNSLLISGQWYAAGYWASNDALHWDFLSIIEPMRNNPNGKVPGVDPLFDAGMGGVQYSNCRKLSDGSVTFIGFAISPGWGAISRTSYLYEINIGADGFSFPRYFDKMMPHSGETYDRNEHSNPTTLLYNNKLIVFYTAVDSITNRLAMATCNLSDTGKVPISPVYSPNIRGTTTKANFVQDPALSSLPSWLTWVSSGTATYSFATTGINLLPKNNTPGFRITAPITPKDYDFIEYYIDCEFKNGQGTTGMVIKTGTGYQSTANQVDGVGILAYSGVSFLYVPYTRVSSVTTYADTSDFRCFRGKSGFGIRWWPRAKKAQLLGSGKTPGVFWDVDATMDLNQNFYPTFWRQTNDTMRIMNITLITKVRDTVAPTVTAASIYHDTLSIVLSSEVDYGNSGVDGFTLSSSAGNPALTYVSGVGSNVLKYKTTSICTGLSLLEYNSNNAALQDYSGNPLSDTTNFIIINNNGLRKQPKRFKWNFRWGF